MLLLVAACAPSRFEDRVAMFRRFAVSLPPCGALVAPSTEQVLSRGFAVGERVVVRGQPVVACISPSVVADILITPARPRERNDCERAMHAVWAFRHPALTPDPPPEATGPRRKGASCIPVELDEPGVIFFAPTPGDLFTCDAAAAEVGAPHLTVIITGTGAPGVFRPGADHNRRSTTTIEVEKICRVRAGS
jgi:hypothetical protein